MYTIKGPLFHCFYGMEAKGELEDSCNYLGVGCWVTWARMHGIVEVVRCEFFVCLFFRRHWISNISLHLSWTIYIYIQWEKNRMHHFICKSGTEFLTMGMCVLIDETS